MSKHWFASGLPPFLSGFKYYDSLLWFTLGYANGWTRSKSYLFIYINIYLIFCMLQAVRTITSNWLSWSLIGYFDLHYLMGFALGRSVVCEWFLVASRWLEQIVACEDCRLQSVAWSDSEILLIFDEIFLVRLQNSRHHNFHRRMSRKTGLK